MKYDTETALDNICHTGFGELGVVIEGECGAGCPYCITSQRVPQSDCVKCAKRSDDCVRCAQNRIDDETFLYRLEYFLIRTLDPNFGITVTGGEPSTSSRIWEVAAAINKYSYARKTLVTNGAGLLCKRNGRSLAEYFIETGWDIVLHRDHWNTATNNRLMRYNGLTEKEINALSEMAGEQLSLNCVLRKDGVCSAENIFSYCEYSEKNWNGCPVMFSEIQFDDRNEDEEQRQIFDRLHINVKEIERELAESQVFPERINGDETVRFVVFEKERFTLLGCDIRGMNEKEQDEGCRLFLYPDGSIGGYR